VPIYIHTVYVTDIQSTMRHIRVYPLYPRRLYGQYVIYRIPRNFTHVKSSLAKHCTYSVCLDWHINFFDRVCGYVDADGPYLLN